MVRSMLVLFAAMLLVVGCQSMKKDGCCSECVDKAVKKDGCCEGPKVTRSAPVDLSKVDFCTMCEGVQHLTKDGKCDKCGMAVKDVCPHCPGTQVMLPDGGCSSCGCKGG